MVDINKLKLKFPAKKPKREKSRAAIKAIALEFERKRIELGLSQERGRHGFPYYMLAIAVLLVVGAFVVPLLMKDENAVISGKSKMIASASNSVHALAIALGRFQYHTGRYPTAEEGLKFLAYKLERPELRRVPVEGWDGPYIERILPDPWGREYVYDPSDEKSTPVLFSLGPDGLPGTADDIVVDPADYDEPFRDKSWLKGWVPQHLRGYVVVQNEEHRRQIEDDLKEAKKAEADRAKLEAPEDLEITLAEAEEAVRQSANMGEASGEAVKVRLLQEKDALGLGEAETITLVAVDGEGRYVFAATNEVTVSVEGPGEILRALNTAGDMVEGPVKEAKIPLVEGSAIVSVRREPGSGALVTLWAKAKGLASDRLVLEFKLREKK